MSEEKRGIEEAYTSAMTSSNLRVEADVRGDADIIIAAGWSQSRVGGALLRLHTEYDGSEKPRLLDSEHFLPALTATAAAEAKGAKLSREQRRLLKVRAFRLQHDHNLQQLGRFLQRMRSLPDVRTQVTLLLTKLGAEHAEAKAVDAIRWWLHPLCPACNGTKLQTWEPGHSPKKACDVCKGSGQSAIPHGQEGRAAVNWMTQCIERHRASIGRRIRDRQELVEARTVPPRADGQPQRFFIRLKKETISAA